LKDGKSLTHLQCWKLKNTSWSIVIYCRGRMAKEGRKEGRKKIERNLQVWAGGRKKMEESGDFVMWGICF
jgi:hypothetical protein